jgi:hypothetical protein
MNKKFHFIIGIVILSSVVFQIIHLVVNNQLKLINYLSLFTIQTNILLAVTFILISGNRIQYRIFLRGTATLSILITGLGFIFLLGAKQSYLLPAVNLITHYLAPLAGLISWILLPINQSISYKSGLAWIIYPLIYFLYIMTRGYLIDWYPYNFINPKVVGINGVLTSFLMILSAYLIIIYLLLKIRGLNSTSDHS